MTGGPGTERRQVVVIGVGNEFRRDDGIGPEVVTRLRGQAPDGVRLLVSDGDPTRMIEAWTGASLAVVVDTVLADAPAPGRLHRIVVDRAADAAAHPVSSHGLGLGESIALAQALDRMPERLVVHAVEAADVGHGLGLTPAVAAAADALTTAVLRDLPARADPDGIRPRRYRPGPSRFYDGDAAEEDADR
jgi:hydrogenase maturation protease